MIRAQRSTTRSRDGRHHEFHAGHDSSVSDNTQAIGYISLGALNDTVKAVSIDGVAATVENIKNGTYSIARPFNIATLGEQSEVTKDFIAYILSADGQKVIEDNGYISVDATASYTSTQPSGTLTIAGSSSVTPVMEKLVEAYKKVNPNATIELQQSDSTTGMNSAAEGVCDIGMASRELKDSELAKGLTPVTIAIDGIAVIVNKKKHDG
jgi:phosphate transport system substrate-binding protein